MLQSQGLSDLNFPISSTHSSIPLLQQVLHLRNQILSSLFHWKYITRYILGGIPCHFWVLSPPSHSGCLVVYGSWPAVRYNLPMMFWIFSNIVQNIEVDVLSKTSAKNRIVNHNHHCCNNYHHNRYWPILLINCRIHKKRKNLWICEVISLWQIVVV